MECVNNACYEECNDAIFSVEHYSTGLIDATKLADEENALHCALCNAPVCTETRKVIHCANPEYGITSCVDCAEKARAMVRVQCEGRLSFPITAELLEALRLKDVDFQVIVGSRHGPMTTKNARIAYPSATCGATVYSQLEDGVCHLHIPTIIEDGTEGFIDLRDLNIVIDEHPEILDAIPRQEGEQELEHFHVFCPYYADYTDYPEFDAHLCKLLRAELIRQLNK